MFLRSGVLVFVVSAFFTTGAPPQRVKTDGETFAVQRFETLWLVTYINDAGLEAIAQAPAPSGELVPLMAADGERLKSIIEAGKVIAASRHIKLRLIRFSQRSDIGEFAPAVSP
jgi:hypothetical protein